MTYIWLNQQDVIFNLNRIFKSPSNFFDLHLKIYHFSFLNWVKLFCICLFSFLSQCYDRWNELVSVMIDEKWYILRNMWFVIFRWLSFECCIDECLMELLYIIITGLIWWNFLIFKYKNKVVSCHVNLRA